MALQIYPNGKAPLSSNQLPKWFDSIGMKRSAKHLGAVVDTTATGTRWSRLNRGGNNPTSEKVPLYPVFQGGSLGTGFVELSEGYIYKQGYLLYYRPDSALNQQLSTRNLQADKHYMLCLSLDFSKDNTSVGKIVDNNYSSVLNQGYFEFIEYDPQIDLKTQVVYERANKNVDDASALPLVMLAAVDTNAANPQPTITPLYMTYHPLKTTKRGDKQLVGRFASNQSAYPQGEQVNLYGNNYNQTTVLVIPYPVNNDDASNRTYVIGDNNASAGAHAKTQRVPWVYKSYSEQPYGAGALGLQYISSKPWTFPFMGRNEDAQIKEYLSMKNEATFHCHTAGLYKFDVSLMIFGAVSYNVNNRWHGLAMYVERGANAPAGMRKRFDSVQENIRDDNFTSGTSGARSNGYGVTQTPRQTLRTHLSTNLYEGDEVFFILYCDMHDITTYGSGTRARFEHENLEIWYMGDNTTGNKDTNRLPDTDFEAGYIGGDGALNPAVSGLNELRSKNFYPATDPRYNVAAMTTSNSTFWSAIAWYDAAGTFISRTTHDEGSIGVGLYHHAYTETPPAGATQFKICYRSFASGYANVGEPYAINNDPTAF